MLSTVLEINFWTVIIIIIEHKTMHPHTTVVGIVNLVVKNVNLEFAISTTIALPMIRNLFDVHTACVKPLAAHIARNHVVIKFFRHATNTIDFHTVKNCRRAR